MTIVIAKMVVKVGAMVRGDMKGFMEDLAFALDLKLTISETSEFLGSRLRVTVEGPDEKVQEFTRRVEEKSN